MIAYIIAGAFLLFGILIFSYLVFKAKKKHKAIKKYEELRDKLTLREAEEETGVTKEEYEGYGGFNLGSLIGGFVVILVGTSLVPQISKEVMKAQEIANVTGASSTILGLTTVFFCLAFLLTGIAIATSALRGTGL